MKATKFFIIRSEDFQSFKFDSDGNAVLTYWDKNEAPATSVAPAPVVSVPVSIPAVLKCLDEIIHYKDVLVWHRAYNANDKIRCINKLREVMGTKLVVTRWIMDHLHAVRDFIRKNNRLPDFERLETGEFVMH